MAACGSSVRVHEGVLYKRGKVNKGWKERWFVMSGDFKLNYYETQKKSQETFIVNNDRNILGTIPLLQIEKIQVSLIKETSLTSLSFINKYKYINVLEHKSNDKNDIIGDRCYLIHLVTSSRTYKLSANDNISFIGWIECLHKHLYCGIIFESFLDKKGEVNKAFKTRYFTLNKYKQLKYYNNANREILHGFIDLNDPSIKLHLPDNYYFDKDNFIELETVKRKWILCAKQHYLFSSWTAFLRSLDAMDDVKISKYSSINSIFDADRYQQQEEKEIYKEPGHVFKLWLKAQQDIKLGRSPTICSKNSVRLKNVGKKRRQHTTVHDIQQLLDICSISRTRRSFGDYAEDFTDNEMDDDEDEEYEFHQLDFAQHNRQHNRHVQQNQITDHETDFLNIGNYNESFD